LARSVGISNFDFLHDFHGRLRDVARLDRGAENLRVRRRQPLGDRLGDLPAARQLQT
jgi:hypothetical protein